jgi:hypothetical protein
MTHFETGLYGYDAINPCERLLVSDATWDFPLSKPYEDPQVWMAAQPPPAAAGGSKESKSSQSSKKESFNIDAELLSKYADFVIILCLILIACLSVMHYDLSSKINKIYKIEYVQ